MSDLNSEIVAALVSGMDERSVAARFAVPMERVRAGHDESMAQMFAPGFKARMRAESLATLDG
jgi:hypothetical protein